MANIKMTDMKLAAEDLELVKGGPLTGYLKIPDIDGESFRATSTGYFSVSSR